AGFVLAFGHGAEAYAGPPPGRPARRLRTLRYFHGRPLGHRGDLRRDRRDDRARHHRVPPRRPSGGRRWPRSPPSTAGPSTPPTTPSTMSSTPSSAASPAATAAAPTTPS